MEEDTHENSQTGQHQTHSEHRSGVTALGRPDRSDVTCTQWLQFWCNDFITVYITCMEMDLRIVRKPGSFSRSTLRHRVCKVKVNPWHANTGIEGRRWCINYHFETRRNKEVSDNTTLRPLYPPQRYGNHCTGWRVDLGASLDGMENLVPSGFDPPIWDMMPHTLVEVHRRFKEICRLQHHGCFSTMLGIGTSLKTTIPSSSPLQWPTILEEAQTWAHTGGSLRLMLPEKMLICFKVDK